MLMKIALELSKENLFIKISPLNSLNIFFASPRPWSDVGEQGYSLWNEEDGFFYDVLNIPGEGIYPLKVRSLVGLLPLFAVETLDPAVLQPMQVFVRRIKWFVNKRPDYTKNMASISTPGVGGRRLMSILDHERLVRVLGYMLDENEFLSDYGIRSISKYHKEHPYRFNLEGKEFSINYQPAESENNLYGGNSNWRGPIWFPINFLIIESLQKFHYYYGDNLKVPFPTHSTNFLTLNEVATELSKRLIKLFLRDETGRRPIYGGMTSFRRILIGAT